MYDGEHAVVCLYNEPVGTVVLVKNETHRPAGDPSEGWNFTAPELSNPSLTTAPNGNPIATTSDTKTFTNVPAGTAYTISGDRGQRACGQGAISTDFETRALAQLDSVPSPTHSDIVSDESLSYDVVKGHTTYIVFNNAGCGTVLDTSTVLVKKFNDPDPNNPFTGTVGLDGWTMRITGTPNAGGTYDSGAHDTVGGLFLFSNIPDGSYTITETLKSGWANVGSTLDGTSLPGISRSFTLALNDHREIDFYNQQLVNIHVTKLEVVSGGNHPGSGWHITVTGCGITPLHGDTNASGVADFIGLPVCPSGYTVSEDPASKGGFAPVGAISKPVIANTGGATYTVGFRKRGPHGMHELHERDAYASPSPSPSPSATPTTPVTPGTTPSPSPS